MAKCYNCGKSFDYEKFYGICPKCSAYNRDKLPEEEHEELHEQYDAVQECQNQAGQEHQELHEQSAPGGYQFQGQNTYGYVQLDPRPKSSSGTIILFIFLILGIVIAIGMPFVYFIGKSMGLGAKVLKDTTEAVFDWSEGWKYPEDGGASLDDYADELPLPEVEHTRQSVEVTVAEIGSPCVFGKGPLTVTVTGQPYIVAPSGQMEEFPRGENLVAVPVSYLDESSSYDDYNSLGIVYAGYGEGIYRGILPPYEVTGYTAELDLMEVLDAYSIVGEEGQGVFLVFVPEEYTSFSLFLESRDEETNQMAGLYEIPMELPVEASDDAQSGEAE